MLFLKKYQTQIALLILILVGFFLRFHLACTEDLATDEIATMVTASQQFPKGIINALVTKNFHVPLYYFILHFWIQLFGDSIISLRIITVLLGTLCIPIAYACGKELISEFAGFIVAIMVTINAFMINYSYFGKFYALLEILGFLSVYLIIKIYKNSTRKYFLWLLLVNVCIIYTYVIGFVFVGIQFIVFVAYDFIRQRHNLKIWISYACLLLLLVTPVVPMMLDIIKNTQNPIAPGFWWYDYRTEDIASVFMTWFSPAVPTRFIGTEIAQALPVDENWSFGWNVLPTFLAGFLVYVGVRKEKIFAPLMITAVCFLLCEFIATKVGRFAFVPRYTLLVFPAVILATGSGIALLSKRKFSYYVFTVFLLLNMCYGLFPILGLKLYKLRNTILPLEQQLENLQLHKGDKIIIPMRGYLLTYFYHPEDVDIISFDLNYVFKTGNPQILSKIYSEQDVDENQFIGKQKFKRYINSKEPTEAISNYLEQSAVKDLNQDSRIVFVDNCIRPEYPFDLEKEKAKDEMSDKVFFYAFCDKVSSDVKAVLWQNKLQPQTSIPIPGGQILVYLQDRDIVHRYTAKKFSYKKVQ